MTSGTMAPLLPFSHCKPLPATFRPCPLRPDPDATASPCQVSFCVVSWLAIGTSSTGEDVPPFPGDQPFSPSPLLPLAVPHPRYRTTYFDNLRGTWKSRMYWKYKKNRGLAKRASGAG